MKMTKKKVMPWLDNLNSIWHLIYEKCILTERWKLIKQNKYFFNANLFCNEIGFLKKVAPRLRSVNVTDCNCRCNWYWNGSVTPKQHPIGGQLLNNNIFSQIEYCVFRNLSINKSLKLKKGSEKIKQCHC